jgi:hypothetical protein
MRVTAVSDLHQKFPDNLPGGDLLIDAGDWTFRGRREEIIKYLQWQQIQLSKYSFIVFICGNHELTLCPDHGDPSLALGWMKPYLSDRVIYLQQSSTVINGVKIYGDPHTPEFGGWGFNVPRGKLHTHWSKIPECAILLSHGPPRKYGDFLPTKSFNYYLNEWEDGYRYEGCDELLEALARIRPKFSVHGHLHFARGVYDGKKEDGIEGVTIINAASCDEQYNAVIDKPIQFEI